MENRKDRNKTYMSLFETDSNPTALFDGHGDDCCCSIRYVFEGFVVGISCERGSYSVLGLVGLI